MYPLQNNQHKQEKINPNLLATQIILSSDITILKKYKQPENKTSEGNILSGIAQ